MYIGLGVLPFSGERSRRWSHDLETEPCRFWLERCPLPSRLGGSQWIFILREKQRTSVVEV